VGFFLYICEMNVIESIEELNELKQKLETEPSVWYPMWVDNEKHPLNTNISFVFISTDSNRYILPQQHSDCLGLTNKQIVEVLNTKGEKWVFQKKKLLHSFQNLRDGLNDIDTSYFLKTGEVIDYSQPFQHLITPYYHKGYRDDIIQSIPILKLCESIENELSKVYKDKSSTYDWYNNKFIPTLSEMEGYGVRVDRKKFIDRWPQASKHISSDNLVYTEYNPFTVTGRPSNRHGGVNYAALNKSDGSRECFVSDGIFLQMDYNAYHPRLIGKLIGFQMPDGNVHEWLAEQYGCDVNEGKGITFQLLYGGIDDTFRQIPYLNAVADYIDELWIETQKWGYLQTKYRRIPLSWIEGSNPQKVFNYLLQALETEMNVDKLEKILEHIRGTDCRFSLYTYDSVLLDYPIDGNTKLALELKEIITEGGFPIKGSWGIDYGKV
jgi:hypothetical protein